jgi:uncharacterized protein with HEPN domain
MKEGRTHRDFMADMLEALDKAGQFVEGMTYEEFSKDDKTVYAVTRALEIIGEASKEFRPKSESSRRRFPGGRSLACGTS